MTIVTSFLFLTWLQKVLGRQFGSISQSSDSELLTSDTSKDNPSAGPAEMLPGIWI